MIARVREGDLEDLLPLMRGYCDFYEISPSDERLLRLSRMLLDNHDHDGLQLIARDPEGRAVGFATIYWSFSTHATDRIAVMNDLFVAPDARGTGLADELIRACAEQAQARGAAELVWQTAKDNARAQAVYERMGAERSEWLDYTLPL
jgi:ribosomal protein S18 acetylase RimI-like enzyme